jgi:hypothetical protein
MIERRYLDRNRQLETTEKLIRRVDLLVLRLTRNCPGLRRGMTQMTGIAGLRPLLSPGSSSPHRLQVSLALRSNRPGTGLWERLQSHGEARLYRVHCRRSLRSEFHSMGCRGLLLYPY